MGQQRLQPQEEEVVLVLVAVPGVEEFSIAHQA